MHVIFRPHATAKVLLPWIAMVAGQIGYWELNPRANPHIPAAVCAAHQVITTAEQCNLAAAALGWADTNSRTGALVGYPYGCNMNTYGASGSRLWVGTVPNANSCRGDATHTVDKCACSCFSSAGTYCDPLDAGAVAFCPAGSYCIGNGAIQPCPPGTYAPVAATGTAAGCLSCPGGYYCPRGGYYSRTQGVCPEAELLGSVAACNEAAALLGWNGNATHSRQLPSRISVGNYPTRPRGCSLDSAGLWVNTDAASVVHCTPAQKCPCRGTGAGSIGPYQKMLCITGHYCPAHSDAPLPCPLGTFGNTSGAMASTNCTACSTGYVCNKQGLVNQTLCPAGHYCPAVELDPVPCGFGTWSNVTQATTGATCMPCEAGFYCDALGTVNQTVCPVGHYCENVAAAPTACGANTYSSVEGAVSVATCQRCPRFFSSRAGSASCGIFDGWWALLFIAFCLLGLLVLSAAAVHLVPRALGTGVALGLSSLALLLMTVGLALPMYRYTSSVQRPRCSLHVPPYSCSSEVTYGIRDTVYTVRETGEEVTINMWDRTMDRDAFSPEARTFIEMSEAAFAMAFLGMLANLVLVPACAKATGYCTACVATCLGDMRSTTTIGAVTGTLYCLSFLLASLGPNDMFNRDNMRDTTVMGAGLVCLLSAFLCTLLVPTFILVGMAHGEDDHRLDEWFSLEGRLLQAEVLGSLVPFFLLLALQADQCGSAAVLGMLSPLFVQLGNLVVVWHLGVGTMAVEELSVLRKALLASDLVEIVFLISFTADCNKVNESIFGSCGILFVMLIEFGTLKDLMEKKAAGSSAPGAIVVHLGEGEVQSPSDETVAKEGDMSLKVASGAKSTKPANAKDPKAAKPKAQPSNAVKKDTQNSKKV